jgi:NTE family protein
MAGKLAFVLGGGGARGALQVGALRALFEADIIPDMLVGTSAGGVNSAFLAMRGCSLETVEQLAIDWEIAAEADLLPSNYLWLTLRILFDRRRTYPHNRMRDHFIAQGLSPQLRFKDLNGPQLFLVAADLKNHKCMLFGEDPDQFVLDGLCASTALPPWVEPIESDSHLLIDGGILSVLPVEPAIQHGASEIIALDICDYRYSDKHNHGFGIFLMHLNASINQRQINLELSLARSMHIPVHHITLQASKYIPIWDFGSTRELIEIGYEITSQKILEKQIRPRKFKIPFLNFPPRRRKV